MSPSNEGDEAISRASRDCFRPPQHDLAFAMTVNWEATLTVLAEAGKGNEEWRRLGNSRRYGQPKRTRRVSVLAIISHESGPRGAEARVTEHAQPVSERGVAEKTLCGIRPRPGFYGRWFNGRSSANSSSVSCAKCLGCISRFGANGAGHEAPQA